jgi:A/G-specific adenine glycosylase
MLPQASRAAAILTLDRWFALRSRVLPWRSEPTLYRVWVSEIMLQQTQVVTVLPYFERFMQRFPTVEALASASEAEVVEAWAGLGYYSRARNLHRGAKQVVASGFPKTREGWIEIPGVGPYTAGAITSIALGHAEPILDGNVERVLARVLALSRAGGDARFKARLWKWSGLLVRRAARLEVSPSRFNQALMELGALVCTFRNPKCGECPVQDVCAAKRLDGAERFPGKKPAKEWVRVEEVRHAWIARDDGGREVILLRRQAPGEWRAGLWDLVLEAPAVGKAALIGEIATRHVVTRHKIERTTKIWNVSEMSAPPRPKKAGEEFAWTSFQSPELAGSASFQKTWKSLREFRNGSPR